jgi:uncharacterized protein YcaQ
VLRLSVTAARRLAVRAQRLDGPAPRGRPEREAILDVCRSLRCLQVDPTNVVARNHQLVVFSRLGRFDPALLERLPILHEDRLIGRADLSVDRKRGRLVAHAIHREPDAPRGKTVARAIRRELERLARWQGAAELELREVPAAWPLG